MLPCRFALFLLAPPLALSACAAPSPPSWQEVAVDGLAALRAGPMVGHVLPGSATLWMQSESPGALGFRGWVGGEERGGVQPAVLVTRAVDDGCVQLTWSGLEPQTEYVFAVNHAGGVAYGRFRTPPAVGEVEELVVAFGSCAGNWGPDPTQPVWHAVQAQHPDLFLWLGDNIYFEREGAEWEDPDAMTRRWRTQRALPALQPLLGAAAHYAIWDDHDYGPDNSDRGYAHKDHALQLFDRYWAGPRLDEETGVYQHFRRGRLAFFLLDGRRFRAPDAAPTDGDKPMLGEAQWRRLEADLAACADGRTDWVVVLSGNQVLADYHRHETWGMYPRERERLLALLAASPTRVLLLSGDRHLGEVLVEDDPVSGRRFVELTSSPLAAGIGDHTPDEEAAERRPGSEIRVEHFGVLRFSWRSGVPQASFQPISADGTALRPPLPLEPLAEPGKGR